MTALAIGVGVLAGLCVAAMTSVVNAAHVRIFGIPFDVRLSAAERVAPLAAFGGPMAGGLLLGAIDVWLARRKAPPAVDPVEANALRGGRMSLRQSLLVAMQTVISNGCGASVGLEAGYAQIGAGVASYLGIRSRLRRQDLRMLVGCGAGGAIAAAFGAPLTGAFYAFELIIGAYSLANAIPVFAATLAASLTTQAIIGAPYDITAPAVAPLTFLDYGALIGLGLVAAAVGVGAMRVAALIERAFRAVVRWRLIRPVVGGLMVGSMALYSPQVLGAGHGALGLDFYWPMTATELATLIALKLFACLVSLASGFRGGLFFASLFVGSLVGKLYSIGVDALAPSMGLETTACVLVGMGALSAAIVGGPLTMTFLVLESTGNLGVAGGVLADHARGAGDLRLFVHHLAPPFARRNHPRRAGRRLAAGSDGRADDGSLAPGVSRRPVGSGVPGGLSDRQRQCGRRDRRRRTLPRADPRRRSACAAPRERRRRGPG
jgi:chloride channel protein, CIC family